MNPSAARHTARADQLAAELRTVRSNAAGHCLCDALDPCDGCKAGRVEVATRRHLARVGR